MAPRKQAAPKVRKTSKNCRPMKNKMETCRPNRWRLSNRPKCDGNVLDQGLGLVNNLEQNPSSGSGTSERSCDRPIGI